MSQQDIISTANYYKNIHILDRQYKAAVLIEDMEDLWFWEGLLTQNTSGKYKFFGHSRSNSITGGCTECLRYKDYFNEHFFACIDSDLRLLKKESGIDVSHYICQTYTYSWENHCCEAVNLQHRYNNFVPDPERRFNFERFLSKLSEIVYVPLIILVNEIRNNTNRITLKEFRRCIPNQCSNIEMINSGEKLLERIASNFSALITSDILSSYDLDAEKTEYESIGLNKSNAYLHIRGHEIYDLVKYIGTRHCPDVNISFQCHILDSINIEFAYPEMSSLVKDLKCL